MKRLLKVALLSVVCDAPARCAVQNFIQYNGWYGCGSCYAKGETFQNNEGNSRSRSHIYRGPETRARTHEETVILARKAEDLQSPHFGVKGFSVLLKVPQFDIIKGISIDYMHCVLLRVMKCLLYLWLYAKHKGCDYFIGSYKDVISRRLKSLKPHIQISRLPRTLQNLGHWKASEYRSFLLYYAVPCLTGILPRVYFEHFLLLQNAIYNLLRTSISRNNLIVARDKLTYFCTSMDILYGPRSLTSNIHALGHLADKVNDLGPLWSHSCFFL